MKRLIYTLAIVAIIGLIAVAGSVVFVYSGLYNIGADAPHTQPVLALLDTLRERSIEARAKDIVMPDLDDPQLILQGAGQYAAMCTGCHLKPGMADSEIRPGLYPQPPNLSKFRPDPREAFWVIKHGIKMSAMPAWGSSHDDATIWSMVAFLQKLPDMTPEQYRDIVAKAPPDEDMEMDDEAGHSHEPQAEPGHAGSAAPATAGSVEGAPVAPASVAQPASVAVPASVSPPGRD